jgi:hypothetical protein
MGRPSAWKVSSHTFLRWQKSGGTSSDDVVLGPLQGQHPLTRDDEMFRIARDTNDEISVPAFRVLQTVSIPQHAGGVLRCWRIPKQCGAVLI